VGRVLANEAEVVAVLKKGNLIDVNVVDTAKMSYYDQLKVRVTVVSLSSVWHRQRSRRRREM
jgi:hypothetical protein